MGDGIDLFLSRTAYLFMSRRFETLAEVYATPLPVYTDERVVTHVTRGCLVAAMAECRALFDRLGVVGLQGHLVARGLPRGRRVTLMVDWHYDMGPGHPPERSALTYYCRQGPSAEAPGLLIEMVEYRRRAFPFAMLVQAEDAAARGAQRP